MRLKKKILKVVLFFMTIQKQLPQTALKCNNQIHASVTFLLRACFLSKSILKIQVARGNGEEALISSYCQIDLISSILYH